jgi:hypothetical protein
MKPLVIKKGYVDIPLQDEKGESMGIVSFNPKDLNLLDRLKSGFTRIEEKVNSIQHIDCLSIDENIKIYKECDEFVKAELNIIFDYDVSSILFGNNSSFSSHDGSYWIMQFIHGITPIIQTEIKKELKASENRVSKYTKDYEK